MVPARCFVALALLLVVALLEAPAVAAQVDPPAYTQRRQTKDPNVQQPDAQQSRGWSNNPQASRAAAAAGGMVCCSAKNMLRRLKVTATGRVAFAHMRAVGSLVYMV